jgi:carboxypeptidase family protein
MLGQHTMSFWVGNVCLVRRMPPRAFLGVAVLASFIFWTSAAATAQATTSLRGTVVDQSGSTVVGANVVLSNSESKIERSAITGEQGTYQFLLLPPGTYKLIVTASGFQRYELTSVQLLVNTPATINAQLKIGAATETVTVSSEQPALNMVDASIGNSFGETQVKQVPLEGRNVPDLLSLQAGVAYTGNRSDIDKDQDTRNGSVNGARSDQSNITLDGVDVNDQSSGYAFTSVLPVTLDSVQEFRVTTTNYGADQGQGSGAQVALVTKSGTDQFHGSLYEYLRNTFTSANDYLVKGAQIRDGQANKPLKLNRNIFGVSLGGPLRKDRLFFFTNYEGTREREEQSVVRSIPTPSMCQGNLSYQNVNGGITTLTPADILKLDPIHQGINPVMLNLTNHTGYLDKTFCTGQFITNDTSVGDGLNYSGFRFRAPVSLNNNAFITRLDYHVDASGKHTLFWRGALQNLSNPQAPLLPGGAPIQTLADHSKGFALGYTALLNPAMVNSFHWGFTRQSVGVVGNANQEWNTFIGLDQGIAYSHNSQLPVNNFADDFSWTKGTHTLQFGTNVGIARNARTSFLHSFNFGLGTSSWMSPTALADSASPLDPTNGGFPEVNLADKAGYDRPMIGLLGIVSDVVAQYNYTKGGQVENYNVDANGNPISPTGLPMKRHYGLDWYEFYGQDSWRVKPNLTLTYGLRWSLFPSPWETNGMQAASAFSLGKQFNINESNMKQGLGYTSESTISLIPGGPVNHGPGFYQLSKSDFAPRISVAYSPRPNGGWLQTLFGDAGKTSIRAGFGEVYDRAGFQLLNTFDQNAPGGFAYTLQNTCCQPGIDDAADVPRIANVNVVPTVNRNNVPFLTPAPPGAFPQTLALNAQANLWVVDDTLKTPHSYSADFSIGRELPHRFALQLSYIGRFGGHLLTQRDLNQPLDIVDPKSGIDYYAAATALSKLARANPQQFATAASYQNFLATVSDSTIGPTAAYWHDMLPALPAGATSYTSFSGATLAPGSAGLMQAVYDLYYNPSLSYVGNEIVGLADIDLYGGLGANNGKTLFFNGPAGPNGNGSGKYLNSQAISAYGWSSVGNSNYNALQATLSKQLSEGLQFDLNYTYSKSIDITSTASRVGFALVGYQNIGLLGSRLENAFKLNALRAVSDFDTTHQINANWILEMPFGRGRRFLPSGSRLTEAVVGGWQLSGLARWTTGFPVSIDVGQNWPTDWQYTGLAQMNVPTKAGVFRQPDGSVTLFKDPATAQANFGIPLPGGSGSRNVLRADGYAGLDMALSKRWKTFESQSLQFRWEVFNVLNQVRFNAQGVGSAVPSLLQAPSAFGTYSGLLTQPRVMQFALRYEF